MLSIIIPTYNSQSTIKKCISSIIRIKKIKYEIILIDDGSEDNTYNINNMYAKKFSNIHSFKQNHQGVSAARNTGLYYAQGSLICFVDSDDYINSTNLEEIILEYAKPNIDLIIPNILINNKLLGIKDTQHIYNINNFLRSYYPLYGDELIHIIGNKIYKSSIIKDNKIKFPTDVSMGEDLIFNLHYLLFTRTIVQSNLIYYYYFIHSYSTSNKFEKHAICNKLSILKAIKNIYMHYNLSFKAFNWLKIKVTYSILLNSLKIKPKPIKYLANSKKLIFKQHLIPNKSYNYNKLESCILQFLVLHCPTILLYVILKIINLIKQ